MPWLFWAPPSNYAPRQSQGVKTSVRQGPLITSQVRDTSWGVEGKTTVKYISIQTSTCGGRKWKTSKSRKIWCVLVQIICCGFPRGKKPEKKCRSREILCSASSNVSMDFCPCVIFIGVRPNLRDIESFNVFLRSLLDPIFQPGGKDLAGGGAPCQES